MLGNPDAADIALMQANPAIAAFFKQLYPDEASNIFTGYHPNLTPAQLAATNLVQQEYRNLYAAGTQFFVVADSDPDLKQGNTDILAGIIVITLPIRTGLDPEAEVAVAAHEGVHASQFAANPSLTTTLTKAAYTASLEPAAYAAQINYAEAFNPRPYRTGDFLRIGTDNIPLQLYDTNRGAFNQRLIRDETQVYQKGGSPHGELIPDTERIPDGDGDFDNDSNDLFPDPQPPVPQPPSPNNPPPVQTPKGHVDPLILSLSNSTVQLTSVQNGINFDFFNDGSPHQTAWITGNSAMLVLDPSGGAITNGSQLLGNGTPLSDGSLASSGFAALAALSDSTTQQTRVLNSSDPLWNQLRLLLPDGTTETLTAAGIVSINLSFDVTGLTDPNGNIQVDSGTFTFSNGSVGTLGDYNLAYNQTLSGEPNNPLPETPTIAALPDLPASGNVYSLHQAMLHDTTGNLQSLVQQFIATNDPTTQDSLVGQIMLAWVAVTDPTATSSLKPDYTVLGDLEGVDLGNLPGPIPGQPNGIAAEATYQQYKEWVWAKLMVQTHLSSLWNLITNSVDPLTGATPYNLSAMTSALQQELSANYQQGEQDIVACYRVLVAFGIDTQENSDFASFYGAFASDPTLKTAMDTAGKAVDPAGTFRDDALPFHVLNLAGAAPGQQVFSGTEDTLLFDKGDGQVNIAEAHDATLVFGSDILPSDVYFETANNGAGVIVQFKDSNDSITIGAEFNDNVSINYDDVQFFQFADGTRLTLNNVQNDLSAYAQPNTDLNRSNITASESLYANGNDTVTAGTGDDTIIGGAGTESLVAGSGIDTLITGVGNTTMRGGSGSDFFVFNPGAGVATIIEPGNSPVNKSDTLEINDTLSDVTFTKSGNDLLVKLNSTGDVLTVKGEFSNDQQDTVQTFTFSDGNVLALSDIQASYLTLSVPQGRSIFVAPDQNLIIQGNNGGTIYTNDGSDTVYGGGNSTIVLGAGQDVIDAGAGVSSISGGSGDDTFLFNQGDGQQTISINGGNDSISFGSGITASELSFTAQGTNLIITINDGSNDQIVVQGQLSADPTRVIQSVGFADGTQLTWAQIQQQFEIAGTAPGDTIDDSTSVANDVIAGAGGNETILLGSGSDTVVAGAGSTTITAGQGADTYVFAKGDGTLTIDESNTTSGNASDTLALGAGIAPSDVSFSTNGANLILSINGTTDQVILSGALNSSNQKQVSTISFADGETLTLAQAIASVAASSTSDGSFISDAAANASYDESATSVAQLIELAGQGDHVKLGSGNSILIDQGGGATVAAGSGNQYIFAVGSNNVVTGGSGNDIIAFGTGSNDIANAGSGDDTFVFNYGQGTEQINESGSSNAGASDIVSFGSGITEQTLVVDAVGTNLVLTDGNANDQLTIVGGMDPNAAKRVHLFEFADGSRESLDQLLANGITVNSTANNDVVDRSFSAANETINASGSNDIIKSGSGTDVINVTGASADITTGSGDDTVTVSSGNNLINLGNGFDSVTVSSGHDVINAGAGSDIFEINPGGGIHTINEPGAKLNGATDALVFGSGLSESNIQLSTTTNAPNDLTIGFTGSSDEVILPGALSGNSAITDFQFADGTDLSLQDLLNMGINVADNIGGVINLSQVTYNESITLGDTGATLGSYQILHVGSGNDNIHVKSNYSQITLGSGVDTVTVDPGISLVTIAEPGQAQINGTDTLKISTLPQNLSLQSDGSSDLFLVDTATGNKVVLTDLGPASKPINIVFGDDSQTTLQQLLATNTVQVNLTYSGVISPVFGALNENITASGYDQTVVLGGGNDTLAASGEFNHVTYGSGDATVTESGDNATINAGVGNASTTVSGQNDTFNSTDGSGNQDITLTPSASSFTFIEHNQTRPIGTDTLHLNSLASDIVIQNAGTPDLVLVDQVTGATVNLQNVLTNTSKPIDLVFSDGTQMSLQQLLEQKTVDISATFGRFNLHALPGLVNEDINTSGISDNFVLANGAVSINATGDFNTITLGAGNDTVNATGDGDMITAGTGNGVIYITGHNDIVTPTIVSTDGSGNEDITVGASLASLDIKEISQTTVKGTDTIHLSGVLANLSLEVEQFAGSYNLYLVDNSTGQTVELQGVLNDANPKPINFVFGDGTQLSLAQLLQQKSTSIAPDSFNVINLSQNYHQDLNVTGNGYDITVGSQNDTITSSGSFETIALGSGNDTITSSGSDETITLGSGNDTVVETGDQASPVSTDPVTGQPRFNYGGGSHITAGSGTAQISDSGNQQVITLGSGNATVTSSGLDDTIVVGTGNANIVSTGAGTVIDDGASANGVDNSYSPVGTTYIDVNGTVYLGNAGNNTIAFNGNTTVHEGKAGVTYEFGAGSGTAQIDETAGNNDTLVFGPGITFQDVYATQQGNNLVITLLSTGDQITLAAQGTDLRVNKFVFADGTTVDYQDFVQGLYNGVYYVTGQNQFFSPSSGNATIVATGDGSSVFLDNFPAVPGDFNVSLDGSNESLTASSGNSLIAQVSGTNDSVDVQAFSFGPASIEVSGANDVITSEPLSHNITIKVDSSASNLQINESSQQSQEENGPTFLSGTGPQDVLILTGRAQNQVLSYNADTETLTITDSVSGQQIHITDVDGSDFLPTKPIEIQFGDGTQMTLNQLLLTAGVSVSASNTATDINQQGYGFNETVAVAGNSETFEASAGNNTVAVSGNNAVVQTGSGNSQITLTGSNDRVDVERSVATSRINVQSNNDVVESFNGSGNETITLNSGKSGLQVIEDGQDGRSAVGTDTIVLQGLNQNQVSISIDSSGNLDVNNLSGTRLVTVTNASGDSGTPIKPVELQFADGSQLSVQQITGTNTSPQIISVGGLEQNQSLSFDGTNLTITDSVTGQTVVEPYNFDVLPATAVKFSDGTQVSLAALIQTKGVDITLGTNASLDLSGFDYSNVVNLAGAGSSYISGAGNDILTLTGSGASAQTANGNAQVAMSGTNESLLVAAGSGNTQVNVTGQSDTIESSSGSGNETINVGSSASQLTLQEDPQSGAAGYGTDTVVIGGLAANQTFTFDGSTGTLTMTDSVTGQQVNFADSNQAFIKPIELKFSDGTQISLQDLVQQAGVSLNIAEFGYYDESQSSANENITMGAFAGVVTGSGHDVITATGQNEFVQMGSGNDQITINGNFSSLSPGGGDYQATITGDFTFISGGSGNAQLNITGDRTFIQTTTGTSDITISGSSAFIEAGPGDSTINVTGDDATISQSSGNSTVNVVGDFANIEAGSDNENITVDGNHAFVDLGSGNATVSVLGVGTADTVAAGSGTAVLTFRADTTLDNSSFQEVLTGTGSFEMGSNAQSLTFTGDSNIALANAAETLIFGLGSGNDVVDTTNVTANSILQFGPGVTLNKLNAVQQGNDLIISIVGTSDSITLTDENATNVIGKFMLADGTVVTPAQMTATNSTLVINSSESNITFDESAISQNAQITITGTNDVINATPLTNTISATGGDETVNAGAGNDTITTAGGGNTIHAGAGTDTINAGSGSNVLYGGAGTATFQINPSSDGSSVNDTIYEQTAPSTPGTTDVVAFGAGINSSDLVLTSQGCDLTITDAAANVQVTLSDEFMNTTKPINEFTFSDGTVLTLAELAARGTTVTNTQANVVIDRTCSPFNETIYAQGVNDTVLAGSGNDTIWATAASATVTDGTGNDIVVAEGAGSTVTAGAGTNTTYLYADDLTFNGNGGTDTIYSDGSHLSVTAGSGSTTVNTASGNNNTFTGSTGTFTVYSTGSNDTFNSGSGNMDFNGSGNNDTFIAGAGNDVLFSTGTNATLVSGTGNDALVAEGIGATIKAGTGTEMVYLYADGLSFTGAGGADTIYSDGNNLNVTAGSGSTIVNTASGSNDTFTGSAAAFSVSSTGNNETFNSGSGTMNFWGSGNDDTFIASTGNDELFSTGTNATLISGTGNDILVAEGVGTTITAGTGTETVYLYADGLSFTGVGGTDSIYADGNNVSVTAGSGSTIVNTASGNDNTFTGSTGYFSVSSTGNNQVFTAGSGDAYFNGSGSDDVVSAGSGNDTFYTYGTNASITGGSGNDVLVGFADNATITGGSGIEAIYFRGDDSSFTGTDGTDSINLTTNNDSISIGSGTTTIADYGNNSTITLEDANGSITASGANDVVQIASSVQLDGLALFESNGVLQIGFADDQNMITVTDQGVGSPAITKYELSNGEFLSTADINALIQQMTAYAAQNGITISSVADVEANTNLMNMLAGAWHR